MSRRSLSVKYAIMTCTILIGACVRQETFVLSAGTGYGWVVVEQRASCAPSSARRRCRSLDTARPLLMHVLCFASRPCSPDIPYSEREGST